MTPSVGLSVKFLAWSLGLTAAVLVAGYWPTVRLAGSEAVGGMLAGCGISLVASWIGAIPIALARREAGVETAQAILLSTGLRFAVVLVLALSVALSGWFARPALLTWVAISYVVLLPADTLYAVRLNRMAQKAKE